MFLFLLVWRVFNLHAKFNMCFPACIFTTCNNIRVFLHKELYTTKEHKHMYMSN